MTNKFTYILTFLALVVFAATVFAINFTYLPTGDDWSYSLNTSDLGVQAAFIDDSFWHIAHTAFCQEKVRPVVHFMARLFCTIWNPAWPYCNTLVMFSLLWAMFKYSNNDRQLKSSMATNVLLMLALSSVVLISNFCCGFIAGSCNYLWGVTATMLFLLFRRYALKNNPDWPQIVLLSIAAVPLGCLQESFAVPVGFAIFISFLEGIKKINWRLLSIYVGYAIGAILLIWLSVGPRLARDSTDVPTMANIFKTTIKFTVSVIPLWFLSALLLFSKRRKQIICENGFELLVILGNFLLVLAAGFYGARTVILANVIGIIVLMREVKVNGWWSHVCGFFVLFYCVMLLYQVPSVRMGSRMYTETYKCSSDGVTINEKVNFPLGAAFNQERPGWNPNPDSWVHGKVMSLYYNGNLSKLPCAISQKLYDNLYMNEVFCSKENRLRISDVEAYTSFDVDAIVCPILAEDSFDYSMSRVSVEYDIPKGIGTAVKLKWYLWHLGEAPHPSHPVVLTTKSEKKYVLVSKRRGCEKFIKSIRFTHCDEKW